MPINCYTGLMGSGKSFEVVSQVILNAIAAGRRVVTNVDGIDNDAIRAYLYEKRGIPMDKLGTVVHCKNDDVPRSDFFPHGKDVDTLVKPGDLVAIDEAWRFWGTSNKLLEEHKIFFREHRHYVDEQTKVSCDLVLMVQDIGDLHRILKVVVELTFRTTKIKSLGMARTYRVEMWEGYKTAAKARVSVSVRNYDKEIFPLYSSYSGGQGKELTVDSRQNILRNPKVWIMVVLVFGVLGASIYGIKNFFSPSAHGVKKPAAGSPASSSATPSSSPDRPAASAKSADGLSSEWRILGVVEKDGRFELLIRSSSGHIRFLSRGAGVVIDGLRSSAMVDGQLVTYFSGAQGSAGVAAGLNPMEQPKK